MDVREVHVSKVALWPDGSATVYVKCCYCGKEHDHGPGTNTLEFNSTTDCGQRMSACHKGEYKISMSNWPTSQCAEATRDFPCASLE